MELATRADADRGEDVAQAMAADWLPIKTWLSHPADCASSSMLSSRSASAVSGAGSPGAAMAVPGTAGICRGGRAVVQRSVHDLASLQYQRMSAHAGPPSGTSRPSGSAVPHRVHWAISSGRSRSRCEGAGVRPGPGGDWPEAVQVPFPGTWLACQLPYWTCRGLLLKLVRRKVPAACCEHLAGTPSASRRCA
jgi:hypothetical protein